MSEEFVGRDVVISVKGLSGFDEEGESLELVTGGKYAYANERAALEYMETELTGLTGTRTRICVEPECVTLTRSGVFNMQMIFQEGRKHYFNYNTPEGSLMMGINTRSIRNELREDGGRLCVSYLLDLDTTMRTRNSFEIEIMKG